LIETISTYTDWAIFGCILITEAVVFWVLKFKMDKSGIITLLIHLMISIMRVGSSFLGILAVVCGILVWMSLHYFIFEMWYIKNTLAS